MRKRIEILYKNIVMQEIEEGATCEDIIKRHPEVSMYYARKWSGDVYHKKDLAHYVRDRYKWPVLEACAEIENDVVCMVGSTSRISEEEWDTCFNSVRKRIYLMLEEIVQKN